jgi:hypothetical protein
METKELARIVDNSGIEKTKAQTVLASFSAFFDQASEWEAKTKGLVITDASQTVEMALAREGRLQLKEIRVNAEKAKKKLKENILVEGRFIDAIYNLIEGITKPIEAELLEKEKFIERQEQAKKEALRSERAEILAPYEADHSFFDLAELPEDNFNQLVVNSKLAHEAKQDAIRKAEAERIERERQEEERRQAAIVENARLKAEAEKREAEIAAERAKAETERVKREKAEAEERAKQQAIIDAALEAERKARQALIEKQQADDKARCEAEAKAEAERVAKAKAEREAAKAGDREKVLAYIASMESIALPVVKSMDAQAIIDNLVSAMATGKSAGARL